ncbi:hypothetical protein JX266_007877 [Neoarthrinium moseri]|uniref:uncharacterized protein n=1 Tax=Neoarthrinium moseri TaxID=1658444 RepID=UPI001FDB976C|nr:uncharacterized protein JN550_004736 [Neoarthrinium moseri]KAI1846068.1 hypothetical protein JX266_007877 [Neoarthrinium moseri]KAI1871291.1 hypothetical protein JN550_004736 [Neoarthrinium moseri]
MSATDGTKIFGSLNKAQCRAVGSRASTVAILAGPGSGKTHTLTSRVAWLIDHARFEPKDIIVATFTVKAAREMKERIGKALGDGRERKIILGTFHSVARRYLATYGQRIGLDPKFGIADDSDSRGIVTRICKRLDIHIEVPLARAYISRKKAGGSFNDETAKARRAKSVESVAYETCYAEYQSQLERSNLLDYDDLLVRCVELLRQHPSCVSNIQAVLIDEYQDTNGIQFELMKLFAQYNRRITIVGDPDQSIYGWRSAEIRNLHRFLRDFPGTEEISLEENYRSSSSILDTSLKVIQQDKERYQKALLPVHNKGTRPVLRRLKNQLDEADWIVSEIKRIKMMSGDMVGPDDIAILLRSASLSRHIESALGRAGMAYRMVGGFKFYERTEIKQILDYLRIIHQPHNNDALARIINVPKRGIGKETIQSLVEEAERNSLSLWELLEKHCRGDRTAKTNIRKQTEQKISGEFLRLVNGLRARLRDRTDGTAALNLVEIIEKLLRDLQFEKFLEETCPQDNESRWANVQEFIGLAGEFMRDQAMAEEDLLPDVEGMQQNVNTDVLSRFLANVSLASDKQTDNKDEEAKPHITVSTIHAAKGLEWPIVFIPAVYKGSIPHKRSDDEAEERRLLQGPTFERKMMTELARMLQRKLPSEEVIYKNMPPMSSLEDNLFPTDPNNQTHSERASTDTAPSIHPMKRHKTHHVSSSAKIVPESVEGWNVPYATTMQRSSSFTLPGFTTAGAQHVADAAEQASKPAAKPTASSTRVGTNKRPPGQRSLLGYIVSDHDRSKSGPEEPDLPPQPPNPPRYLSGPRSLPIRNPVAQEISEIQPQFSNHKLGSAKLATKPAQPKREIDVAAKPYACFSSSPSKPSPEKPPAKQDAEPVPPEEQTRPALCFHATTVNVPQPRGVKRPAGLGRDGIAPIDRLRKPFKPLTINKQLHGQR